MSSLVFDKMTEYNIIKSDSSAETEMLIDFLTHATADDENRIFRKIPKGLMGDYSEIIKDCVKYELVTQERARVRPNTSKPTTGPPPFYVDHYITLKGLRLLECLKRDS